MNLDFLVLGKLVVDFIVICEMCIYFRVICEPTTLAGKVLYVFGDFSVIEARNINYSKLMYSLPIRCAYGSRTNHSNCELGGPRICNHGQESYAIDVNVVSDDKALETTLTSSIKTKNKEDAFNVCLV